MGQRDWTKPFLKLKDKLQPLYETHQEIYHGVVIAPHLDAISESDYNRVIGELEASFSGEKLLYSIETPGSVAALHSHYFYGDKAMFSAMSKSLSGISGWVKKVPKDLLPDFLIPHYSSQTDHNLILWTSIVYYLAWKLDSPYLSAIVEQVACAEQPSSFFWEEWPQPPGFDPRHMLIHQSPPYETIEKWKDEFQSEGPQYVLPDIIDAYLGGSPMISGFITASLTAIDSLVYMLETMLADEKAVLPGSKKLIRVKTLKKKEHENEIKILTGYLITHHTRVWEKFLHEQGILSVILPNKEYTQPKPLTCCQIATAMKWISPKTGKPLQTKVTRLMKEIFGPQGMMKYKNVFKGEIKEGIINTKEDGSSEVDAVVYNHFDRKQD